MMPYRKCCVSLCAAVVIFLCCAPLMAAGSLEGRVSAVQRVHGDLHFRFSGTLWYGKDSLPSEGRLIGWKVKDFPVRIKAWDSHKLHKEGMSVLSFEETFQRLQQLEQDGAVFHFDLGAPKLFTTGYGSLDEHQGIRGAWIILP